MPNATFIESAVYGDVLYGMTRMLMSKNVTTMTSAKIRIRSKPLSTRIRISFQKREGLSRELLGVGEKLPSAPQRDFFMSFILLIFAAGFGNISLLADKPARYPITETEQREENCSRTENWEK